MMGIFINLRKRKLLGDPPFQNFIKTSVDSQKMGDGIGFLEGLLN